MVLQLAVYLYQNCTEVVAIDSRNLDIPLYIFISEDSEPELCWIETKIVVILVCLDQIDGYADVILVSDEKHLAIGECVCHFKVI